MAWLFISHSGEDEAIASRVRDFLAAEGYGATFLDFDAESGLRVGQEWEPQLWSELRRADAVLFLDSAASRRSKWCFAELAVARAIGLTIIPLIVGEESQDGLIGAIQGVNLSEGFDGLAAKLGRALREVDPAGSFGWDRTRAPYPGLQAFEPEDAAVFFGREDEVKELERRLHPTLVHGARRLLVLVGPSGSGKSSLVRAGLIPRLGGRSGWLVLPPMEPGLRPVSRLAGLLARALGERDGAREIERRLRSGADALLELGYELSERAGAATRSVLLVVDQAEELATVAGAEEAEEFASLLRSGLVDGGPFWAIATVRSEFLEPLLGMGGLESMCNEKLVLPLGRARLFRIVQEPARRAGLEIDAALVARMVDETVGGDALPLLAYTLRRLWERSVDDRQDGRITVADYEAVGGVVGSLREQADAIMDELRRRGRGGLVLSTLTQLATIDGDGEPTRRRIALGSVDAAEREVMDAFVGARLATARASEGEEATVEVSHEALLRHWPPLREAIEEARTDLRTRSELERLSSDWEQAGRRESYLLRGDRLDAALVWASSHQPDVARSPLIGLFLEQGKRAASATLGPGVEHYDSVLRHVVDDSLVIVLGPEVNRAGRPSDWSEDSGVLPDSDELAAALARRFDVESATFELASVAQTIFLTHGRPDLHRMLSQLLGVETDLNPVHRVLTDLAQELEASGLGLHSVLIIDTNLDWGLTRAFDAAREPYDLVTFDKQQGRFIHGSWNTDEPVAVDAPREYRSLPVDDAGRLLRTIIVKPYGLIRVPASDRRMHARMHAEPVVTTADLDNYMSRSSVEEVVPCQILEELRESHWLFLGSAPRDQNLHVLMRRLWLSGAPPAKSWAIEPEVAPAAREFWLGHGISPYSAELAEYVERVTERIGHATPPPPFSSEPRPSHDPHDAVAPPPDSQHYRQAASYLAEEGSLVPVLGLGVNAAGRDGGWHAGGRLPPDSFELSAGLARRFSLETGSLADVAQRVVTMLGRSDLDRGLRRTLSHDNQPGAVHRFLARVPSTLASVRDAQQHQLIVTTTFDTALERAFDEAAEPYDLAVYMTSGSARGKFVHVPWDGDAQLVADPTMYSGFPIGDYGELDRTVIVKLFGSADGSFGGYASRGNVVVTSDDLADWLSGVSPSEVIPFQILDKLRYSHLLFLGHDQRDRSFNVLIQGVWEGMRLQMKSWAVQQEPSLVDRDYWSHAYVDLFAADLADYVARLERCYEDPSRQDTDISPTPPTPPEPPAGSPARSSNQWSSTSRTPRSEPSVREGPKIFINHLHEDTAAEALLLHDRLAARFGAESVFLDGRTSQPGLTWLDEIEAKATIRVFLALIGRSWLSSLKARQQAGAVDGTEDYVRLEIEHALRRGSGLIVIPVLIGDAAPPFSGALPRSLQALTKIHAEQVRLATFDDDTARLTDRIETIAREHAADGVVPATASPGPPPATSR